MNALQRFAAEQYECGDMIHAVINAKTGDFVDDPIESTKDCGDSLFHFVMGELEDLDEATPDVRVMAAEMLAAASRQLARLADAIETTEIEPIET